MAKVIFVGDGPGGLSATGEVLAGDYLVLAEGKSPVLARSLALGEDERGGI